MKTTEADISSSAVQLSSASESSGLPTVDNSMPSQLTDTTVSTLFQQLTDTVTQLLQKNANSATSGCQDNDQKLSSATAIDTEMSGHCDGSMTEKLVSIVELLCKIRNSAELLTSALTAKRRTSGSDSAHGDSNTLPPDDSGDVANGNVDADEMQQQHQDLTDACGSNNEATADSTSNANCRKTSGLIECVKSTLKPLLQCTAAIVHPFRTAVTAKMPEFVAQGNCVYCNACFIVFFSYCLACSYYA